MSEQAIQVVEVSSWALTDLRLELTEYGENKGKYTGRLSFSNKERDSFTFNIRPEMAQPFIDLIAKEVAACANKLGDKLITSLHIPV